MRRVAAVLATTMVAVCALTGCSGSDRADESDGSNSSPAARERTFSVETALRELPKVEPAGDQPLQVFATDFALAAELGDLPKPDGEQSTATWFRGLSGPKIYVMGGEGLGLTRLQTGGMRKVLGFDARDITTASSVESLPDGLTVVHLSNGVSPKDVSTTGDGKIGDIDPAGAGEAPFPQIFGVAHRGDQVALAKTQESLDAWTARGNTSLADHEAFLDVAQALDAHHVYDVILNDRPGNAPFYAQEYPDEPASVPEFDAVGVAQGVEDGEAVEYIAYRVKDVAGAEERIRAVWEDGFSFPTNEWFADVLDVEDVSTDGNVVTVTIVPKEEAGLAAQMLMHNDTPFFVLT